MSHHANPHTPDSALAALTEGQARFVAGRPTHPHADAATREDLAAHGQAPLAAVLACSDSRAPVELLFDQGFGDLFIVRAAGQVPGPDQLGSLEYAVAHLGVPLVLVLGHTRCGAVTAAVQGAKEPGALGQLLARLDPVVRAVADLPENQRVEAAVEKTVDFIIEELRRQSPVLAQAETSGRIRTVGAIYNLDSGQVAFR